MGRYVGGGGALWRGRYVEGRFVEAPFILLLYIKKWTQLPEHTVVAQSTQCSY